MTLTFNSQKYSELLAQYQPKLIRTEAENKQALALVEELMHRLHRSPEENELYDLLVTLIEKFEQEYYSPDTSSNPHSMLLFLMDQRGLEAADLAEVFDSEAIATDIITNQVEFSKEQIKALGQFFQVDPGLFL
ncbi:MAG: transcriptional regulator [Thermosynechococcaceae cyanobacterium]